jgi:hypothetical protein
MTNDPSGQYEIYYTQGFIQLDLSGLIGKNVTFSTNSTSGGDTWEVLKTSTLCTAANLLSTCSGTTVVSNGNTQATGVSFGQITGANTYYDFVETAQAGGKKLPHRQCSRNRRSGTPPVGL